VLQVYSSRPLRASEESALLSCLLKPGLGLVSVPVIFSHEILALGSVSWLALSEPNRHSDDSILGRVASLTSLGQVLAARKFQTLGLLVLRRTSVPFPFPIPEPLRELFTFYYPHLASQIAVIPFHHRATLCYSRTHSESWLSQIQDRLESLSLSRTLPDPSSTSETVTLTTQPVMADILQLSEFSGRKGERDAGRWLRKVEAAIRGTSNQIDYGKLVQTFDMKLTGEASEWADKTPEVYLVVDAENPTEQQYRLVKEIFLERFGSTRPEPPKVTDEVRALCQEPNEKIQSYYSRCNRLLCRMIPGKDFELEATLQTMTELEKIIMQQVLDRFCDGLYHKWMNLLVRKEKPKALHEASMIAEEQEEYQNFLQSRYDTNQLGLMIDLSPGPSGIFQTPAQPPTYGNGPSDAGIANGAVGPVPPPVVSPPPDRANMTATGIVGYGQAGFQPQQQPLVAAYPAQRDPGGHRSSYGGRGRYRAGEFGGTGSGGYYGEQGFVGSSRSGYQAEQRRERGKGNVVKTSENPYVNGILKYNAATDGILCGLWKSRTHGYQLSGDKVVQC